MKARRRSGMEGEPAKAAPARAFDVRAFLTSNGSATDLSKCDRGETVFMQGDACDGVLYIDSGGIKLSVRSKTGREAVVAILGPGEFFGEACLTDQRLRNGNATAITPSVVRRIARDTMLEVLHRQPAMADYFIAHILSRNVQIEQDLIAQLFNSSEKRLARALLLLARYGTDRTPVRVVAKMPPAALATLSGTTPERVTFLLNKFRKLGFIEQDGQLPFTINRSLLSVMLHD